MNSDYSQECIRLIRHEIKVIMDALDAGKIPTQTAITSLVRYHRLLSEKLAA
jgi:hypothetical protein